MPIEKDIQGYEGIYVIRNDGSVISLPRTVSNGKSIHATNKRILKPYNNGYGYYRVSLNLNGKRNEQYVHRLVAIHFIKNPENKPFVNHIDNNPSNNNVNNLEWVTHKENMEHCCKQNRNIIGSKHKNSKLTESDVLKIKAMPRDRVLQKDIAKIFNVSRQSIGLIKNEINWKHVKLNDN